MKTVGLTGGIGSGKTAVANFLIDFGVQVYNSDVRAKALMNENPDLIESIQNLLGRESYQNKKLNRSYVAKKIFNNQDLLNKINALVHPVVFADFEVWKNKQKASYVVKESAILIESGAYQNCDFILVVQADVEQRIERVMARDNISQTQVLSRIKNQMTNQERKTYANYTIENNQGLEELKLSTHKIHKILLERFA